VQPKGDAVSLDCKLTPVLSDWIGQEVPVTLRLLLFTERETKIVCLETKVRVPTQKRFEYSTGPQIREKKNNKKFCEKGK